MRETAAVSPHVVPDPPATVRDIAARLEAAGFETWCVGGAIRDAFVGSAHLDWDLATAATPDQVRRLFRRTIPVGEAFGTVGVLDTTGRMHEVTTFRRDVKTDGRHAEVAFGVSLDDDLARRDFTINAMAWSASQRRLHDPFGGMADLQAGIVRAVGDAPTRMREDRLRALRALRFAGRFGFAIEPQTWNAIVESAPSLHRLSKERLQQELVKTMQQVRRPGDALRLWKDAGALREVLPPLDSVDDASLTAADHVALPDAHRDPARAWRRVQVRFGAVLAGLNKAAVTTLLRDLRFSGRDITRIAHIAAAGADARAVLSSGPGSDLELRQLASRVGRLDLADALRVNAAVAAAHGADAASRRQIACTYRRALRIAWRDPVEIADLVIDGEDLMRDAGVAPGPQIGATLRTLRDWVLADPARNARDVLIDHARSLGGH